MTTPLPPANAPALEWARYYRRRGWYPIPVPYRQKSPALEGWQTLRLEEADLSRYFDGQAQNVGVLLGEPSQQLVDIDLDAREAGMLAPVFLPPTECRFGRPGKPDSHWLYQPGAAGRTEKFLDATAKRKTMLVEYRATGGQTIFPGSVHADTGEHITWIRTGDPAAVEHDALRQAVVALAASTLLARHWPLEGSRHETTLAAAGVLLRAAVPLETVVQVLVSAARVAGDPEWRDRRRDVLSTYDALQAGRPVTGIPRLRELLDDRVVTLLLRWLIPPTDPTPPQDPADLPLLDAGDHDLPRITAATWAALERANHPPTLFARAGIPTRIERDPDGGPMLRMLDVDRLKHHVARAATWYSVRGATRQPAYPPDAVIRDLLAHPAVPLPALDQLVSAPVFTPAGSLLIAPGYDAPSRLFYAPPPGFTVPAISPAPDAETIAVARTLLLEETLGDFPFVGAADRAHAVSLLLTPFLRSLIAGPVPLLLFEKPAPGTGATLLTQVIAQIVTGTTLSALTEATTEEEWRKRLFAALLTAPPFILIDNVRRPVDSSALSSVLTATRWSDRILGRSEVVAVPVRCAWIVTGNNPVLSTEMMRRTIPCRLDARTDRPWERTGFAHPDLLAWTRHNRATLVWAALTLGQAWLAEGRPPGAVRLGMFEDWSTVLGGVLQVAQIPGFLENRYEFYDRVDTGAADVRAFLAAWWERYGETPQEVKTLLEIAKDPACPLDIDAKSDKAISVKFGKLLASWRDRVYTLEDSSRIQVEKEREATARRTRLWRLTQVTRTSEG